MNRTLSRRLFGAAVAACAAGAVFLLTGVLYKAITYHEEEIYFLSSWGYTWNELFVRHVVDTERSPWVQVNYEIHEGQRAASGVYVVDSDTLILVVSGPRREVMRTVAGIESQL